MWNTSGKSGGTNAWDEPRSRDKQNMRGNNKASLWRNKKRNWYLIWSERHVVGTAGELSGTNRSANEASRNHLTVNKENISNMKTLRTKSVRLI